MPRSTVLQQLTAAMVGLVAVSSSSPLITPCNAFAFPSASGGSERGSRPSSFQGNDNINSNEYTNGNTNGFSSGFTMSMMKPKVAYRSLSIDMPQFGANVPVAMWFSAPTEKAATETTDADTDNNTMDQSLDRKILDYPSLEKSESNSKQAPLSLDDKASAIYSHRISVKKIGGMLANLNFIPEFLSKDFELSPTTTTAQVVDGSSMNLPTTGPVVLLCHGFLGSRFDLAHVAEALAQEGFICFSAEYPESLASSYSSVDGLDRSAITTRVLDVIRQDMKITPTSYGIVGHSLGCGTAMTTGDETWTRVCIAGPPGRRDGVNVGGNTLGIISVNDSLMQLSRIGSMIPSDFVSLEEEELMSSISGNEYNIPKKAILMIDRPDAPNHISFLAGNVNDSMVNFLSPLLPVAQALSIPVLDFDKYKESQDSKETAEVVIPIISSYLKQYMV